MSDQKISYPILPGKWWWALRTRFKQSVPPTVTASYLAAVLDIGPDTASKIALPAIRKVGLIDQTGKPKERAIRWRDDEQYPEVCKEILRELYQQELLEAAPDPSNDRATAARWFANTTGAGESAVKKMTSFYQLLFEANPHNQKESTKHLDAGRPTKVRSPKTNGSSNAASRVPTQKMGVSRSVSKDRTSSANIPSALELLIRSLPPQGAPFPEWQREQWLDMARAALVYLYPNKGDERPDDSKATSDI